MTDLRQGVTENQHAILDLVQNLPTTGDTALLDFAIARARQAARTTMPANAVRYAREAAAQLIAWCDQQDGNALAATTSKQARPAPAPRQPRLAGKRMSQLVALLEDGAISRDTAVAAALQRGRYYPATLSRLVDEGLVEHGHFARADDPRRSLSHYWLSAQGAGIARSCGGRTAASGRRR